MASPSTRLFVVVAVLFLILSVVGAIYVLSHVPSAGPTPTPAGTAGNTADLEARVASADPAQGQTAFTRYGCTACHSTPGGVGPYVGGLGLRAATRRPGYSAVAYLYESIIDPNAFIVPNYPASLMPQNFKATIPPDQMYDLIAWLLEQ